MKIVIMAGASSTESRCRHQSRRLATVGTSFFSVLQQLLKKMVGLQFAKRQQVLKYAARHG
jgi:hypothetical protein